jgi:uncharacterized GH25 family protein
MKRVLVFALMAIAATGAFAQSEQFAYCVAQCFGKPFSTKYVVTLDFSEKASKRKQIYEDGKKKQFDSNGAFLNYMGRRGWDVAAVYTDRDFKQQQVIYFVLKKKITDENQVMQGIETKDSDD